MLYIAFKIYRFKKTCHTFHMLFFHLFNFNVLYFVTILIIREFSALCSDKNRYAEI